MLSDEEKKAIEKINKITEDCEYICMQRNEDTELYSDEPVPYIENRILLNLIEKQEKIIQDMAEELAQFRNELDLVNDTKEAVIEEYNIFFEKVGE